MKSLAVTYRPTSFSDLTEQESIKTILSYQIESKTIKHGYLFVGAAGTGKTTSARIFANMINNGEGLPIELDAASNNSVDDIRDICEQAQAKSLDSEYKVFIIDECHVLSNQAWQAMLKTLEEPPAKSIFILCTTNPEKIPATILSRVQRYNFQRISTGGIVKRLAYIVNHEQNERNEFWNVEPEALDYLARIAEGGMRDAITLMDKCLSYSQSLTVNNVVKALGLSNYDAMFNLAILMHDKNMDGVFKLIESEYDAGADMKQFAKDFFEFVLDVVKYDKIKDFYYIKIPASYENILSDCLTYEESFWINLLEVILEINNDIKWQKNAKAYMQARFALFMESL